MKWHLIPSICIWFSLITQILLCFSFQDTARRSTFHLDSYYSKGSGLDGLILITRHYLSMTCYSSLPVYSKHYTSTKQKLLSPPPKQSIQSTRSSLTFVVFRCFEIVLVQVESMLFSWKYRTKREQIIAKKRYQQLTVYLTFKFSCHQWGHFASL